MEQLAEFLVPQNIQARFVEQIVDIPVPQFTATIAEMTQPVPQDRIHERTMEQFAHIHVPQGLGSQ